MKLTHSNRSVKADVLRELDKKLAYRELESDYLDLRLRYQEASQCLTQYMPHFAGCAKCQKFPWDHNGKGMRHEYKPVERVYPSLLPTQSSGRWSVARPPLVTCSHPYMDPPTKLQSLVVGPDPDHAWIAWDYDAIEAKIVACYSDDEEDLYHFGEGHDIHTITSCNMLGDPLPPNLSNPHTSPECAEWRASRNWQGKDDTRRGLAKVRYCVLYGRDHKAAEDSAYAAEWVKQGGNREELVEAARLFLLSKPGLVACKKKWWAIVAKRCEARTEFGRRRRLFGDAWQRSKEGWNHMVQGWVSDALNIALLDVLEDERFYFVYPKHDAAIISVPTYTLDEANREHTLGKFKDIVERTWTINKHEFKSTCGWSIRWPNGEKENL